MSGAIVSAFGILLKLGDHRSRTELTSPDWSTRLSRRLDQSRTTTTTRVAPSTIAAAMGSYHANRSAPAASAADPMKAAHRSHRPEPGSSLENGSKAHQAYGRSSRRQEP